MKTSGSGAAHCAPSRRQFKIQQRMPRLAWTMKHAFLVGVEDYEVGSGITPVKYARRDVYGIGHALQKYCGFEEVRILADQDDTDFGMCRVGNPTDSFIRRSLTNAAAKLKDDDLFVFLFSGHGIEQTIDETVRTYLLAHNASFDFEQENSGSKHKNRIPTSGIIELGDLRRKLDQVASRHRVILLDCCRNDPEAGRGKCDNLMGELLARNLTAAATRDLVENCTTILMTACHPGKRAWPWDEERHGAFSYFVKAGIEGNAWNQDYLEARDLCDYVQREMRRWSEKTGRIQLPYFKQLEGAQPVVLAGRLRSAAAKREIQRPYVMVSQVVDERRQLEFPRKESIHNLTDLPMIEGRVILSKGLFTNPEIRIYGEIMGKLGFEKSLETLTAEGGEFDILDGPNRYTVKLPYVIIDRLFLDTIHLLADGSLADNFFGIRPDNYEEEEHWMFPFRPEMLRYLDLEKLRSRSSRERQSQVICTSVEIGDTRSLRVEVKIAGRSFSKSYPKAKRNRDTAGNLLDIRIWPNFRFSTNPFLPKQSSDRVYYIRIRQMQEWGLRTQILANNGETCAAFLVEDGETGCTDFDTFRSARLHVFPTIGARFASGPPPSNATGEWEPVGLNFEDRGFCLFRLEEIPLPCATGAAPLRIGVDFGTSNTCIASLFRSPDIASRPEVIRFWIQTDTMHEPPIYCPIEPQVQSRDNEGAAAVLDFPFKYETTDFFTSSDYFPSQLVTRQEGRLVDTNFRLANGLIYPFNPILANRELHSLLRYLPPTPSWPDRRPFRLTQDIKWANRAYRKAYLWHLYKLVLMHSTKLGGRIEEVAFSYPRAFDEDDIRRFKDEVIRIFADYGGIPREKIEFVTESDAMQRCVKQCTVVNSNQKAHVVLDVGAATTDYLGLIGEKNAFQASYRLTAGYINTYFKASRSFRRSLRDAIYSVVEEAPSGEWRNHQRGQRLLIDRLLDGLDVPENGDVDVTRQLRSYSEQTYVAMMNMVEERHYPGIVNCLIGAAPNGERTNEQRAVCGFFYTLVLFYAGMVFMVGRLFKEQKLPIRKLLVEFAGNGSKSYWFLNNRYLDFDKVLANIIRNAADIAETEVKVRLIDGGKTIVAKGLSMVPRSFASAKVVGEQASLDYYQRLIDHESHLVIPELEFKDLTEFLNLLQRLLPGGRLDGATVIPHCEESIVEELSRLFGRMVTAVDCAERKTAREIRADICHAEQLRGVNDFEANAYEEAALSREPVFVTRLKCLLDQVREYYAV